MKQLFIGLADILLGKKVHGDMEIMGAENRSHVVATTNYWLARRYESTNFSFPKVEYTCEESCYGGDTWHHLANTVLNVLMH